MYDFYSVRNHGYGVPTTYIKDETYTTQIFTRPIFQV